MGRFWTAHRAVIQLFKSLSLVQSAESEQHKEAKVKNRVTECSSDNTRL